jgi:hypothetical protein
VAPCATIAARIVGKVSPNHEPSSLCGTVRDGQRALRLSLMIVIGSLATVILASMSPVDFAA